MEFSISATSVSDIPYGEWDTELSQRRFSSKKLPSCQFLKECCGQIHDTLMVYNFQNVLKGAKHCNKNWNQNQEVFRNFFSLWRTLLFIKIPLLNISWDKLDIKLQIHSSHFCSLLVSLTIPPVHQLTFASTIPEHHSSGGIKTEWQALSSSPISCVERNNQQTRQHGNSSQQ